MAKKFNPEILAEFFAERKELIFDRIFPIIIKPSSAAVVEKRFEEEHNRALQAAQSAAKGLPYTTLVATVDKFMGELKNEIMGLVDARSPIEKFVSLLSRYKNISIFILTGFLTLFFLLLMQ